MRSPILSPLIELVKLVKSTNNSAYASFLHTRITLKCELSVLAHQDEISIVDSAIGKQVTVTIARGVDTLTTFTLLLPNNSIQNDAKITAVGITNFRVFPRLGTTSYTLLRGTVSEIR